jgi:hypothetical protein
MNSIITVLVAICFLFIGDCYSYWNFTERERCTQVKDDFLTLEWQISHETFGAGIGFKKVNGERTEDHAIVFLVKEKKQVPPQKMIPKEIQGCLTDVVATHSDFSYQKKK